MPFDIETLSYEQLLSLKHAINKRLEYLDSMNTDEQRRQFEPGDDVCFSHARFGRQEGVILKHNRKTITVITQSGQRWEVSPHLLRKLPETSNNNSGKIVALRRKK